MLQSQLQLSQQLTEPVQTSFRVELTDLPRVSSQKITFTASDIQTKHRYLLSYYQQHNEPMPVFIPGLIYHLEVRLKPPHGLANGTGFDRQKWLFRNRIHALGTIQSVQATEDRSHTPMAYINQWRMQLSTVIKQHFNDPEVNALLHALSIGDQSYFSAEDRKKYLNTGTAHLIAISGLHIGMVAMIGWFLASGLFLLKPVTFISKPTLQVCLGLIAAGVYASLAGLSISTQRALIMLAIWGWYRWRRRPGFVWDVLCSSLMAVLLIDPLNVLDAGFWLSFGAVAVLVLAFRGRPVKRSKWHQLVSMQWVLLVGMLPLSVVIFGNVKLLAPLINLIVVPVMGFVLIPLILMMLIMASVTQAVPEWLCWLTETTSDHIIGLLGSVNQWSWIHMDWTIGQPSQYLLLILGSLLLLLPQVMPQRYWGWLLLFLALLPTARDDLPVASFRVTQFDVGQGLSVLLETRQHRMLYDVGASHDSGFNMADAVLIPFLRKQQITHLDRLVLSHQDNDHAGSASHLISHITVSDVMGSHLRHTPCVKGANWDWDGVKFEVLSPENLYPYLGNNSSCVLRVSNAKHSLLLTGDIEEPVEYRLSQWSPALIRSDVMLVPHHGSKTSSSKAFLDAVNPSLAINSAGLYNAFNHPAETVRERYQQSNISWLDSQSSGRLVLQFGEQITVWEFIPENPRIWRTKKPG